VEAGGLLAKVPFAVKGFDHHLVRANWGQRAIPKTPVPGNGGGKRFPVCFVSASNFLPPALRVADFDFPVG